MTNVMAVTGSPSEKMVYGQLREVTPFVGTDREGDFSSFGVGFISGEESQIWGLVFPRSLIQSWRAMKIFERVPEVADGTLCYCWYAASDNLHESDRDKLDKLANLFPSREQFDSLRKEFLEAVPTGDELNAMLIALREKGVEVESWELTKLIEAGKLASNPLVEEMVREEEARWRQREEEEAIIKEPMAPEHSLAAFFNDLGIGNFIDGGGYGAYGMDWGHIEQGKLDEAAKRDCHSKHLKSFDLQRTTQRAETTAVATGPDITLYTTSFGDIENPSYMAPDGARYTFSKVMLHEGSFLVTTLIEKKGAEPTKEQYLIPQLREMIGPIAVQVQPASENKKKRFPWLSLLWPKG